MLKTILNAALGTGLLLLKGIAVVIIAGVAVFVYIVLREVSYTIHEENKRRMEEKKILTKDKE